MKRPRSIIASLVAVGLMVAGLATGPTTAGAQTGGYQRGPNPGPTTLLNRGPFAVSQTQVSGAGAGYNNVTVCYPNDTSQGKFGGFVVIPGFLSLKAQMMWSCQKIASHGFVVAVMETSTVLDFPWGRSAQAQAVARHLSGAGAPAAVRDRLDTTRWAIGGWSMGGGGALESGVSNNPQLQAVVGWEPWDIASFGGMKVPALIVGGSADFVASPAAMAEPFYNSIPAQVEKYYVEVSGAGHFIGSQDNTIQSAATIAWLKRWVDDDTRYDQFLCPPQQSAGIAEIRQSCPMGS